MSSTPEQERRAATLERILSTANISRRRGDYEAAWRALDDALAVAPDSAALLEMMGRLNLDEGEPEAAAQCFRRALELDPGRPGAEEGLGNALVELKRTELLFDPNAALPPTASRRKPDTAAAMSLVIPGLGQFYAYEVGRGVAFFLAALPCWYFLSWGFMSYLADFRGRGGSGGGPWFWVVLVVTLALHLAACIDAWRVTQALREEEQRVL